MTERKLVTIRTIEEIRPIENADMLQVAYIDGWNVVVKKDQFKVGQPVVFFEVDSTINLDAVRDRYKTDAFEFLRSKCSIVNGVSWARIKTIRLRGQISQGLIVPIDPFEGITTGHVDQELADHFFVKHYEQVFESKKLPVGTYSFPTNLVRKTDQPRIQNVYKDLKVQTPILVYTDPKTGDTYYAKNRNAVDRDTEYEVTQKLDGTSVTMLIIEGKLRVCSRNLMYEYQKCGDVINQIIEKYDIENKMIANGFEHLAIQGELIGPSIQSNFERVDQPEFRVFDVFDSSQYQYCDAETRYDVVRRLGIEHVPVLETKRKFDFETLDDALKYAEQFLNLRNTTFAEGVVFKSLSDPDWSFKIINNQYLLKQ